MDHTHYSVCRIPVHQASGGAGQQEAQARESSAGEPPAGCNSIGAA